LFEKNNNNIPITVSVSRRSFSSRRTNRTFITFARCGLYTATRYFLDFPRRLSRGRPWVIAGAYVCVGRGIPDLTVIYWLWHFYTWPQPFVLDHTEVFVFTFFFFFCSRLTFENYIVLVRAFDEHKLWFLNVANSGTSTGVRINVILDEIRPPRGLNRWKKYKNCNVMTLVSLHI